MSSLAVTVSRRAALERVSGADVGGGFDVALVELYNTMLAQQVNKAELGRRLHWHLPWVMHPPPMDR